MPAVGVCGSAPRRPAPRAKEDALSGGGLPRASAPAVLSCGGLCGACLLRAKASPYPGVSVHISSGHAHHPFLLYLFCF